MKRLPPEDRGFKLKQSTATIGTSNSGDLKYPIPNSYDNLKEIRIPK